MKKLSAYIMLFAFLMMNVAGMAHAACGDASFSGDVQVMELADGSDHNSNSIEPCDCCACGHHTTSLISHMNAETIPSNTSVLHHGDGLSYLSQLHFPPSKPPKA